MTTKTLAPTPWQEDDGEVSDFDGDLLFEVSGISTTHDQDRIIARRLVAIVNAHDRLVSLVRQLNEPGSNLYVESHDLDIDAVVAWATEATSVLKEIDEAITATS